MSNRTGRKFGGRTKGTPNKATSERRKIVDAFLKGNFREFEKRMAAIDNPYQYCSIFLKLLHFVLPECASITIEDERPRETFAEELDRIANEEY